MPVLNIVNVSPNNHNAVVSRFEEDIIVLHIFRERMYSRVRLVVELTLSVSSFIIFVEGKVIGNPSVTNGLQSYNPKCTSENSISCITVTKKGDTICNSYEICFSLSHPVEYQSGKTAKFVWGTYKSDNLQKALGTKFEQLDKDFHIHHNSMPISIDGMRQSFHIVNKKYGVHSKEYLTDELEQTCNKSTLFRIAFKDTGKRNPIALYHYWRSKIKEYRYVEYSDIYKLEAEIKTLGVRSKPRCIKIEFVLRKIDIALWVSLVSLVLTLYPETRTKLFNLFAEVISYAKK